MQNRLLTNVEFAYFNVMKAIYVLNIIVRMWHVITLCVLGLTLVAGCVAASAYGWAAA